MSYSGVISRSITLAFFFFFWNKKVCGLWRVSSRISKKTSLFVRITSIRNLHKASFHLGPPETKSSLMPSAEGSRTFRRIAIIWLCMPRDFHHSSYCQIRFHIFPSHFSFRPGVSQSCLAFIFHYIIVGERKEFK